MSEMKIRNIYIPLVAIGGGICKEDVSELLRCCVNGIALSSSIMNADNVIKNMQDVTDVVYNRVYLID